MKNNLCFKEFSFFLFVFFNRVQVWQKKKITYFWNISKPPLQPLGFLGCQKNVWATLGSIVIKWAANKVTVRPAKTHPPSLISLHSALSGKLRTQCFFMRTAKPDQTGRTPRLIWVFDGARHFVGFVMLRLICERYIITYRHPCAQIIWSW